MPKALLKKFLISLLITCYLLVVTLSSLVPSVRAQTPAPNWYNQNFPDWYVKVYDSPQNDVFGERYTAAQVQWIFYGLVSNTLNAAAGVAGISPKDISCVMRGGAGLVKDIINAPVIKDVLPAPTKIGPVLVSCGIEKVIRNMGLLSYEQKGSNTGIAEFIFLNDRPLSGISYFRNVARNWHLIPEAKAQTPGFGFNALNPVLPLWRASRNVAYGLLVFAILILSFMIMFRVKINPQTVITVQSAIPKVVFALILITFSYAIAGFMVDLMYIVIGLLSVIFSGAWSSIGISFATSPSNFFQYMTVGPFGTGIFGALGIYLLPLAILSVLFLVVGGTLLFTGVGTVPAIILLVIVLIVFISTLIFFLKVIWMLLKAFAYIVLLVIFAPLQIALGVIVPSLGFGQWLRSIAANLAVFPLTGVFLALSYFFIFASIPTLIQSASTSSLVGTPGWPPLLSGGLSGAGGLTIIIIYFALSLVIFAIIPKVADIMKSVIEGKPFAYGAAIGETITAAPALIGRGFYEFGRLGEAGRKITEDWPKIVEFIRIHRATTPKK